MAMQEHYNKVQNSISLSDSSTTCTNLRKRNAINTESCNSFREKLQLPLDQVEEREIDTQKKLMRRYHYVYIKYIIAIIIIITIIIFTYYYYYYNFLFTIIIIIIIIIYFQSFSFL